MTTSENLEIMNQYALVYRSNKVLFSNYIEHAFIHYDLTGGTNYLLFDTELEMDVKIAELFPSSWEYSEYEKRLIVSLIAVIDKYADKINGLKSLGNPYAYINQGKALVIYLHDILPSDQLILEADSDVIIEIQSDAVVE